MLTDTLPLVVAVPASHKFLNEAPPKLTTEAPAEKSVASAVFVIYKLEEVIVLLTFTLPLTSSAYCGLLVAIPTLPPEK